MTDKPAIKKSNQRYQSDIIVDLIKMYGFPYSLNVKNKPRFTLRI